MRVKIHVLLFWQPFYESRPIVQKTLQYDTGYATLSKKNENSIFTRPSDEISMETSDEIATASPLTIYGSFTKAFNMKGKTISFYYVINICFMRLLT